VDVYQERTDLSTVTLGHPAEVKRFAVTTHLLQVSGTQVADVPGTSVRILTHMLDTSEHSGLPELRMDSQALSSLTLHCGHMFGGLRLSARDGSAHHTLLDGLRFADSTTTEPETKRPWVIVDKTVTAAPDSTVVTAAVTSLQFALATAESMVSARGKEGAGLRVLGRRFLEWLAALIPADTGNTDLLTVRARALFLARAGDGIEDAAIDVPYLTYDTYKPLVQALQNKAELISGDLKDIQGKIDRQKKAELAAKTKEEINNAIKATGKLLSEYLQTVREHQSDVAAQHQKIVQERRKEYQKTIVDVDRLQGDLAAQVIVVNNEIDTFKNKIADWEERQWVKFGIDVAKVLFEVGGSILAPGNAPKAAKDLAETGSKLKKLGEVLKALGQISGNLYQTTMNIKRMNEALGRVGGKLEVPAAYEWDELKARFEGCLLATNVDETLRQYSQPLVAAFGIMVLRGRAWVEAAARATQLRQEIDAATVNAAINNKQNERLKQLKLKFNTDSATPPDKEHIDLIALTGEVELQLKQTLSALARTLRLQDGAVQYEYLGTPTPLRTYDSTSLVTTIADQKQAIVNGIAGLQPPPQNVPDPITYTVESVPVKDLLEKEYAFTIPLDARQFQQYAMVRVRKVVARVKGVNSAEGKYLVRLVHAGAPFRDLDKQKNVHTFRTVERHVGPYEYDRKTGKLTFGGEEGPFDKKVTRVTPFSTWKISVPKNHNTNKGVEFTGTHATVELDFHLTAQYPDQVMLLDAPLDVSATNEETLVGQMHANGSALNGWDAC
jgi:hypothetical protein